MVVSSRGLRAAGPLPVFGLVLAFAGCDRGSSRTSPGKDGEPSKMEASAFVCDGGLCTQQHVRLPDDGEWRCAEREGVAWCAGGEPAAAVVTVASDRGFTCGERRVPPNATAERRRERERICVDPAPDVPRGARGAYSCRFAQERGIRRECVEKAHPVRPISARGAPDCWLDADCAPGRCDRGHCVSGAP